MFYRLGPDLLAPMDSDHPGVLVRIGADARKCVVFFGVPADGGGVNYGGTGFLVAFHDPGWHMPFTYVVTCRHVAKNLEKWSDTGWTMRVNTRDGGSIAPQIVVQEWCYHPDPSVDLAAFGGFAAGPKYDQKHYGLDDKNWVDHLKVGAVASGDDVSLVGLFRLHAGNKRNVPIVHSGHVALLPDPEELVPVRDKLTGEIVDSEVFLIEAQTLDGLSGSPVFMHELVGLDMLVDSNQPMPKAYAGITLLGIYTGSWDGEPGTILAADRNLKGGKRVPVGMGTVVPATKLIELLRDHPVLKENRRNYVKQKKAENAASTDDALSRPDGRENPDHREDYVRLLNRAATTKTDT